MEGENIVIEQRHAAQRSDRLRELAAELVRLRVEAIVVYGAVHAAMKATSTIPIIFTVAAYPVGAGYVASLARPSGNVTGLSDFHAGLVGKRLELLKEAVPSVSRVAVLFNPTFPAAPIQLKSIQAAAPAVGATILPFRGQGTR